LTHLFPPMLSWVPCDCTDFGNAVIDSVDEDPVAKYLGYYDRGRGVLHPFFILACVCLSFAHHFVYV
jgi:hypothetical protein